MDICVQWAKKTPTDYEVVELLDWEKTLKKVDPIQGASSELFDDAPGWVSCLCVHGTRYRNFDHYAVIPLVSKNASEPIFKIVVWNDDLDDYAPEDFSAKEIIHWPIQPDEKFGGALNTKAISKMYCAPGAMAKWDNIHHGRGVENWTFHPYSEFIPPPEKFVRHGKWVPDEIYKKEQEVRNSPSWRNWGPDGYVPEQRIIGKFKPLGGTRTYFQRDSALATGVHVGTDELEALLAAGAGETLSETTASGTDELSFIFNTPLDEPDQGTWPDGLYRVQFDATQIDTDLTFGCLAVGGSNGHLARVNSALSSEVDSHLQTQSVFGASAGLKLATFDSSVTSWGGSTQSDRFEVLVAQASAAAHGNETLTLRFSSDAFIDGVWAAPPAGAIDVSLVMAPYQPN